MDDTTLERFRKAGLHRVVKRIEEYRQPQPAKVGKWIPVRFPGDKRIAGFVREGATDQEIRELLKRRAVELRAEGPARREGLR